MKPEPKRQPRAAGEPRGPGRARRVLRHPSFHGVLIFLWTLVVHGTFLASSALARTPVGLFFFGDSRAYLEEARRLALALEPMNGGLPFHPPLTGWLLAPLWWIFGEAEAVHVAAKLLMAALSGATFALFYRLIRGRVPGALPICLLMPLSFGEIALTSAVSNDVPYRLLLLLIVLLGLRWPLLAGALHGAAALTRAEHLPFAVLLLALGLVRPAHRRFVAVAAAGAALVLVPYAVLTHHRIAAYNQEHGEALAEPLPTVVPISFYGPLNFALAQREEGIFFSRRTLPPLPGDMVSLDPTFPPHHDYILHGYARGLETIRQRPGRFVARTAAKVGHSLRALGYGWTWRDLPRGSWGDPLRRAQWVRQPVDIAYAPGLGYLAFCLVMMGLGVWALRGERAFLAVGFALLAYRLGINAVFFPYLRSILIVSPFFLTLFFAGWSVVLKRRARPVLAALVALLGLYHLATVGGDHRYRLAGERTADGAIIDDRRVEIELATDS